MSKEINNLLSTSKNSEPSDDEDSKNSRNEFSKTPNLFPSSEIKTRQNVIFSPIIGNNNYFNFGTQIPFPNSSNKKNNNQISNNGDILKVPGINNNTLTIPGLNYNALQKNRSSSPDVNLLMKKKHYLNSLNNINNDKIKYINSLAPNSQNISNPSITITNLDNNINNINPNMNNINTGINTNINNNGAVSPLLFPSNFNYNNQNNPQTFSPIRQQTSQTIVSPYLNDHAQSRIYQSPDINKFKQKKFYSSVLEFPQIQQHNNITGFQSPQILNHNNVRSTNILNQNQQMINQGPVLIGNIPLQSNQLNDEAILNKMTHKNKKVKKVRNALEEIAMPSNVNPITNLNQNTNQFQMNMMNNPLYQNFNANLQNISQIQNIQNQLQNMNQIQSSLNSMNQLQNLHNANLTPNLTSNLAPNIVHPLNSNQNLTPNLAPNINNNMINNNKILNQVNGGGNSEEETNKINIDSILLCKDKRTTLMIKNIPNKYTITTFLEEINVEFKNKYDLFYLPIDYGNKCNLGFAFINFVEPFHIIYFYDLYRGKKWKRFNSEKICELVYAKIQGKKELIAHFEKGKVLSFESEEKRPLILPTPNPLPYVRLPIKVFERFHKIFPYARFNLMGNMNNQSENATFIIESLCGH